MSILNNHPFLYVGRTNNSLNIGLRLDSQNSINRDSVIINIGASSVSTDYIKDFIIQTLARLSLSRMQNYENYVTTLQTTYRYVGYTSILEMANDVDTYYNAFIEEE